MTMNPRQFAETYGSAYDPATDDYDVPPLVESIRATKATAVYAMHSYHQGKKPHDAIRRYIRHYTRPGDLVLDPFCGSGAAALAALLEGRHAIALDRSPAAAFIASNYCAEVDPDQLQRDLLAILDEARPELDWLYETRCDRCNGPARTTFTVFSERFRCPRCQRIVPLSDCVPAQGQTATGRAKRISVCPFCYRKKRVQEVRGFGPRLGAVPVLAAYRCLGQCQPAEDLRRYNDPSVQKRRFFARYDVGKMRQIDARPIPYWIPTARFPKSFARWRSDLRQAGIESVADLYTKRNLWALAALRDRIVRSTNAQAAMFGLTAICLAVSKMQRYSPESGFPNMLLVGTYYVPPICRELDVGTWYGGKLRALVRGYEAIRAAMPPSIPRCIATGDARRLEVPSDSVDYIFTDPPYADNVQYGELNFVWEAWLGAEPDWHADEIVVNAARGKTRDQWAEAMRQAMAECYRVLKPGRWLSLCYHDASQGTWTQMQNLMAEIGFVADTAISAVSIDTGQRSFNQFMSDKATKRDLVINFRKPTEPSSPAARARAPEVDAAAATAEFEAMARQIIKEFLAAHPGSTKDRIYDELVSRLFRQGRMQPHDFDALLRSVADETRDPSSERKAPGSRLEPQAPGRWYVGSRK